MNDNIHDTHHISYYSTAFQFYVLVGKWDSTQHLLTGVVMFIGGTVFYLWQDHWKQQFNKQQPIP